MLEAYIYQILPFLSKNKDQPYEDEEILNTMYKKIGVTEKSSRALQLTLRSNRDCLNNDTEK